MLWVASSVGGGQRRWTLWGQGGGSEGHAARGKVRTGGGQCLGAGSLPKPGMVREEGLAGVWQGVGTSVTWAEWGGTGCCVGAKKGGLGYRSRTPALFELPLPLGC